MPRIVAGVFLACGLLGADSVAVGITPGHSVIEGVSVPGASPELPRILLLGNMSGEVPDAAVVSVMRRFEEGAQAHRRFHLLSVPLPNPDHARLVFPPTGSAYKDNTESHYLWRWIGTQAPDAVLIAGDDDFGLAKALSETVVAGVGRIPARSIQPRDITTGFLDTFAKRLPKSEARREIDRRLARSARQVADELARYYGHDFETPVYIPGVALIGQLRLGHLDDVKRLAQPYVDGSKNSLDHPTASHLAGHLVFAELAQRTGDSRYVELVRKAADIAMPLHNEMSDAVFMGCPILASAGKLTGDSKYFDMAAAHLRFMQKLCLRQDGIYRHSPLDEAAWGRGNAFPSLGMAWALTAIPKDHPAYLEILHSFQTHIAALAPFQDSNGMWRQVVDRPGSYPEFSATAMIATAVLRGIRNGWLPASIYQPMWNRAWRAILARTSSDGRLIDVCESTGKQKSLDDYLRRVAILDRDPRGGAMALLLATEIAAK